MWIKCLFFVWSVAALTQLANGCKKQSNKDITGGQDLRSVHGKPETECCQLCKETSGCKAFAWNNFEGGTCWLKSADGPIVNKNGVSIGIMAEGDQTANGCKKQSNKDITGGQDLRSVHGKPETECCQLCKETSGCKAFAWNDFEGGTCWLKSADGPVIDKGGVSIGIMAGGEQTGNSSLKSTKDDIKAGRTHIRGVNLGGWLVAEHWMTKGSPAWKGVPEDVANKGEFLTMQLLGHAKGDNQFKQHRDNFIKEQDFRDIAAANLNTVRIPVGYWITGFDNSGGGDPNGWKVFAPGAIDYLDQAIRKWAPSNNLLVLISFHAAKGSQNGNDHSAASDPGKSHWSAYPENVQNTLDAVEWLARRYNGDMSFLGIGLLNEPTGTTDEGVLKQYYYDAYRRIRLFSDCLLVVAPLLSQQSAGISDWNSFMPPPQFHGIRHEWHRYQIWGYEGWNEDRLISFAQNELKKDIQEWSGNWLFIGEWCIASSAGFKNDDVLRRYAQAQLNAFKVAQGGWTYWSWKFYNDDGSRNGWSMKVMINRGLLQF